MNTNTMLEFKSAEAIASNGEDWIYLHFTPRPMIISVHTGNVGESTYLELETEKEATEWMLDLLRNGVSRE